MDEGEKEGMNMLLYRGGITIHVFLVNSAFYWCFLLMREYGCESWTIKKAENWCFWTVVLEKTIKSPLDCKEIQPVHPKGDQSWVFIGRTDVEAETTILWPPDAKNWLLWKDADLWVKCLKLTHLPIKSAN